MSGAFPSPRRPRPGLHARTALLLLGLARPIDAAEQSLATRIEVGTLLAPVVVLNADGHAVGGLRREEFRLRVDGRPREIEYFEGGDAPFALAIAIDGSASMVGRRFAAARQAARELIDRLGPRDRVALIGFDHRARVIVPSTGERALLLEGLERMTTGAGTALYDALDLALDEMRGEAGRKALVLLTDGEDVLSQTAPASVVRKARRSQVVLYPVWLGREGSSRAEARRLTELAVESGGMAIHPGSEAELTGAYAAVLDEMRKQYTIGFSAPGEPDGRWHRIAVDLVGERLEGLHVRARKGWLAERDP